MPSTVENYNSPESGFDSSEKLIKCNIVLGKASKCHHINADMIEDNGSRLLVQQKVIMEGYTKLREDV